MIMTCIVKSWEDDSFLVKFFFYHVQASILGDSVSCQLQFKKK